MIKRLTPLWHALLNWLEHGDLVPWMVIVSAVHYSVILQAHDNPVTATAIGLMVDLGHFRTVRAAVRYSPAKAKSKRAKASTKREALARWTMAAFMTVVSVVYQQRFYEDLWLSLPLPLLIASLAWLQQKDQRTGTKPKAEKSTVEPATSELAPAPAKAERLEVAFICGGCGFSGTSQNALNAHQRACPARKNGKAKLSSAEHTN